MMAEAFTLPYFDKFAAACTYYLSAQKIVPIKISVITFPSSVTVSLNFSDTWRYGICQITSMEQGLYGWHCIPVSISPSTTTLNIFYYNISGFSEINNSGMKLDVTSTSATFSLASSSIPTTTNINGFIYIVN